ncbi:MAG: FeoA family protein [Bacteroidota bacterium]
MLHLSQLHKLKKGQAGFIEKIDNEELKLALLQLGITEGDECKFTGAAPLQDPLSIMVNRTKVTLRKRDAASIWIRKK